LYRNLEGRLAAAQAKTGAQSEAENKQLLSDARDYEIMQFCRLGYFIENREPQEIVGGSLLVFNLTAQDIAFALYAPRAEMEQHRTPH
jgi:hypothetical protein